ncbi:MAG: hypothetical protein LQ337_008993, partial [Flavoplaca oasis]
MAISSFGHNANGTVRSEDWRGDNAHPICSPRNLILPFSCLFRGRGWPISKKTRKRRRWVEEVKALRNRPTKSQTRYPDASTSPIPLKARTKEAEEISLLDLADGKTGLGDEGLGQLPLEIRREIWGYVLGRGSNVLILLPYKIRAVPEVQSLQYWPMDGQKPISRFRSAGDLDKYGGKFWAHRPAILRTCRQIYIEAVELLYCENSFIFTDASTFAYFTKAVLPRRLNAIRKMRICFSESTWPRIPPNVQHAEGESGCEEDVGKPEDEEEDWHSFACSAPTCHPDEILKRREWYQSWVAIASMQNLTSLDITIDYTTKRPLENHQYKCRDILRPLLKMSGIRDFKLRCRVFTHCRFHGMGWRDMRWKDDIAKLLVERIKMRARSPRGMDDVGEDDEMEMEMESRWMGACGCLPDAIHD